MPITGISRGLFKNTQNKYQQNVKLLRYQKRTTAKQQLAQCYVTNRCACTQQGALPKHSVEFCRKEKSLHYKENNI